jgi:hypothetical protein
MPYDPNRPRELDVEAFEEGAISLAISVWQNYYELPDRLRGDHDTYERTVVHALAELALPQSQAENIAFLAKLEAQAQAFL